MRRRLRRIQDNGLEPHPKAGQSEFGLSKGLAGWGNQARQHLLNPGSVQAKLSVSQPGDRFEQEADRVAEQVMRMPDTETSVAGKTPSAVGQLQRKCENCEEEIQRQSEDEETSQEMETALPAEEGMAEPDEFESGEPEPDETGMPKLEAGTASSNSSALQIPRGGGQPLESGTRHFMERRLGVDLGGVRIHTDRAATDSARSLRALAYTVRNNVYFNQGQYRPQSYEGRKLLAHELTHVIQQARPSGNDGIIRKKDCPWQKQKKVVRNDCDSSGEPEDKQNFIRHLAVSLGKQTVTASWGDQSQTTGTDTWDCSPNPSKTPKGKDFIGIKCGINHTNLKKDGMAWFTGFRSEGYRIGFHDSQRVGAGIHSHGCVRVLCPIARRINKNTWSDVTTINVS